MAEESTDEPTEDEHQEALDAADKLNREQRAEQGRPHTTDASQLREEGVRGGFIFRSGRTRRT